MQLKEAIEQFTAWRSLKVRDGTVWGYDRELRYFCFWAGNPNVEKVSVDTVIKYLSGLREYGWHENSMVPKCMAFRKFFEFCRLQGLDVINEQLIPVPRKRPQRPRVATEKDLHVLLNVIKSDYMGRRDIAIIRLLWDTGARNGEMCSLDMQDIGDKQAIIRTEKAVHVPYRRIFWTDETHKALALWISERKKLREQCPFQDENAVFISFGSSFGKRLGYRSLSQMFLKYSKKAGLSHSINPHSFRHRMGHNLAKKGANNSVIASLLGHSNIISTLQYTRLHGKELEEQYRRFNH